LKRQRPAFELEHTLCVFRETPLSMLLDSSQQHAFGRAKQDILRQPCRRCTVLDMRNGGCPRDRILKTPEGEPGLNYLCSGYKRFFPTAGLF
jgi:uncharacterized protein